MKLRPGDHGTGYLSLAGKGRDTGDKRYADNAAGWQAAVCQLPSARGAGPAAAAGRRGGAPQRRLRCVQQDAGPHARRVSEDLRRAASRALLP